MPFLGRARLAPVADPIDRALRDRDEPLVIAVDHEHMALAGRLIPSRINQLRARNQRADDGRAQVIDLVFPRDDARPERERARERERVVREIADDAAVDEAVLLSELVANRQAQRRLFAADMHELGAEQHAEGLRAQGAARMVHDVGHRRSFAID